MICTLHISVGVIEWIKMIYGFLGCCALQHLASVNVSEEYSASVFTSPWIPQILQLTRSNQRFGGTYCIHLQV